MKKGDLVECVEDRWSGGKLKRGEIYTITGVGLRIVGGLPCVTVSGDTHSYRFERFKLTRRGGHDGENDIKNETS